MAKSEERIQNIKEYILEFQFIYHRTPTMAQIAEAVGTVKSNVYKYLSEMEDRGILTRSKREIEINDTAVYLQIRKNRNTALKHKKKCTPI